MYGFVWVCMSMDRAPIPLQRNKMRQVVEIDIYGVWLLYENIYVRYAQLD